MLCLDYLRGRRSASLVAPPCILNLLGYGLCSQGLYYSPQHVHNDVKLFHLKALKLPLKFQSQRCVLLRFLAALRLPVVGPGAAHLQQNDGLCRVVNYPSINPIRSHLHMISVHRDIPEGLRAVVLVDRLWPSRRVPWWYTVYQVQAIQHHDLKEEDQDRTGFSSPVRYFANQSALHSWCYFSGRLPIYYTCTQ